MLTTPKLSELPREAERTSSMRAIIAAVLTAAAAYALANALTVVALERAPQNVGYTVVETKWQALADMQAPVDWLFLGDSSCNQGIMPERVAATLGGTAYNACTIGSATVADDAWMFGWLLERGLAPEHLVIVHTWDTWRRDDSTLRAMLFLLPPEGWRGREPQPATTPSESLLARMGHWVPLASQPRSVYLLATNGGRARVPESISIDASGFMPMPFPNERALLGDAAKHLSLAQSEPFTASDWSDGAVRTLLRNANDAGVETTLVMAPVYDALLEEPDFRSYLDAYHGYLSALADEFEHVRVQPRSFVALPAAMLEKVDHPTPEGAERYTDQVVDWLSARGG